MSFKADLDILNKLSTTLHNLAQEAAAVKPKTAPDANAATTLLSAAAAAQISQDLIYGALVNTAKERLSETGDVMADVAKEFKDKDDNAADALVSLYNSATGAWTVESSK